MKKEKATYSKKNLLDCVEKITSTIYSVKIKKEHFSKCFEVKELFDYCYEKTDCLLFDADYSPWDDYYKLVKQDASKKEMDKALLRCRRYLFDEITGIFKCIEKGEVNCIEDELGA